MRHLREVNGVLFSLHRASGNTAPFVPALGIATLLPAGVGVPPRPIRFRPLSLATMDEFVQIEAPSLTVDGLYGRLLATLEGIGHEAEAAVIRSIMADGAEHYATFRAMREWLGRHPDEAYLIPNLAVPPVGDLRLQPIQTAYVGLLDRLHAAYVVGMPAGALDVITARTAMVGPNGLDGLCRTLVTAGALPVFAPPANPRFAPVAPMP
jgi:hypothetical protein